MKKKKLRPLIMSIKILEYNILHGFHSGGLGEKVIKPFILQPFRLASAQEVVKAEKPDVLVLIEACFTEPYLEPGTKRNIFMDYKKIFDYPYEAHSIHRNEWGTAILSRFPIVSQERIRLMDRESLKVELKNGSFSFVVHAAHPKHDWNEQQKTDYLRNLSSFDGRPYILTGDFNALSDEDPYDYKRMVAGFRKFAGDSAEAKVADLMIRRAVAAVRQQGLIDTFSSSKKKWTITLPTRAYDGQNTREESGSRLDYIFCSPNFKIEDAYVIQNELTDKASDHYPIVAILEAPAE